jgi:hypothetical protein
MQGFPETWKLFQGFLQGKTIEKGWSMEWYMCVCVCVSMRTPQSSVPRCRGPCPYNVSAYCPHVYSLPQGIWTLGKKDKWQRPQKGNALSQTEQNTTAVLWLWNFVCNARLSNCGMRTTNGTPATIQRYRGIVSKNQMIKIKKSFNKCSYI